MPEREWTSAQRDAFEARNRNLVVSAAAGSGKTAVLIRRIADLVCGEDGQNEGKMDLSRIVVVTFSKAAAAELRRKLYEELSERAGQNPASRHIAEQLYQIHAAHISTIHSFCYSVLQEYKAECDLPGKTRICEDAEGKMLLRESAEEALEKALLMHKEGELPNLETVYLLFGDGRSDSGLLNTIVDSVERCSSFPGKCAFLREKNEQYAEELFRLRQKSIRFADTAFGGLLAEEAKRVFAGERDILEYLLRAIASTQRVDELYGAAFAARISAVKAAERAVSEGRFFDAEAILHEGFAQKLPRATKVPPEEAALQAVCKSIADGKVPDRLFSFCLENFFSEKEILEDFTSYVEINTTLIRLLEWTDEIYSAKKREKGLLDYADLEHRVLRLVAKREPDGSFSKTAVGEAITRKLDAVFVDEYQDSNRIQDAIFRAVTNGRNLFIVGDPKQSIYRFRGAEPSIFSYYKNRMPAYNAGSNDTESKILLSHNFRCDKNVIDLTNSLFRVLMDASAKDSLYGKEDELIFAKKREEEDIDEKCELLLIDRKLAPDAQNPENLEAEVIAARIEAILKGEIKKGNGRLFAPSDIAVIARKDKYLKQVQAALTARGIPCSALGDDLILQEPEALFSQSLLAAIENPMDDVALLAVLSSPVFCFSGDDLYGLRRAYGKMPFFSAMQRYSREKEDEIAQKSAAFLETLFFLIEKSKALPLEELIWLCYEKLAIRESFAAAGKPSDTLYFLLDAARSFESFSLRSLPSFLDYVKSGKTPFVKKESRQAVNLLTIHKSKGLEFPILFVGFLGGKFNEEDQKKTLLLSERFGSVSLVPRLEGAARWASAMFRAVAMDMEAQNREEEKRVLYVALTRARSKLYMTAEVKQRKLETVAQNNLLVSPLPLSASLARYLIAEAPSQLDCLFVALHDIAAFRSAVEARGVAENEMLRVSFLGRAESGDPAEKEAEKAAPGFDVEELARYLAFSYEGDGFAELPKKLSVSEIVAAGREEEAEIAPRTLLDFQNGRLKNSAAFIGTSMHEVMQYADFARAAENLDGELSRLLKKGFLTQEAYDCLETEKLAAFFRSDLYRRMASSPRCVHEKRFNVLLDGESLLGKKGEVLVQGVIDVYFEKKDGSICIVDFKTDRVRPDTGEQILLERHGAQLRLYRLAIEAITEKPVSELLLYSFSLGRAIFVPLA